MNFKDALSAIAFGLLSVGLAQYFFTPKTNPDATVKSGQSFKITPAEEMSKPLQTKVEFDESTQCPSPIITVVETPLIRAEFSNKGAIIQQLSCKKVAGKVEEVLTPIQHTCDDPLGAFLVALDASTPHLYNLVSHESKPSADHVIYQAKNSMGTITKEFILSHNNYTIDCTITIEPKAGASIQPRLFLPAPFLKVTSGQDLQQGIVYSDRDKLQKTSVPNLTDRAWATPPIFGAEDRYFLHVLFADPAHFTQRAYYHNVHRPNGHDGIVSILEGPVISAKTTWNMSFYCGPKESMPLGNADKRLEDVLDYGWLAPFSKLLLTLLQMLFTVLHNYGLAIIALTLLLKLAMLPFTAKSERNAQKASDLQKKLQYIEQKYKHDREALAHEKTELMRKHGVMGMAGCLPLFVQIPIFVGLNRVLSSSIELYEAPFLWIQDLSVKDPYFVMPLFIGLGLLLQSTTSQDPRQKLTMMIMALVVVGVTAQISAGLALFIAVSTLSSVIQVKIQKFLQR